MTHSNTIDSAAVYVFNTCIKNLEFVVFWIQKWVFKVELVRWLRFNELSTNWCLLSLFGQETSWW